MNAALASPHVPAAELTAQSPTAAWDGSTGRVCVLTGAGAVWGTLGSTTVEAMSALIRGDR